jgi:hypothetical protein
MRNFLVIFLFALLIFFTGCSKEQDVPMLVFKYTFDELGERQDNFGNPASIPANHAAQTPDFKALGVHSIELINSQPGLPTDQTIVYKGSEVNFNGQNGIDFEKELIVEEGEVLVRIPLSEITPGTYNYLRNSLGYQAYNIDFLYTDPTFGPMDLNADIASFVGFKTYINDFDLGGENIVVNDIVNQGYWAFHLSSPVSITQTGNAPTTTVPNPLDAVSPIPLGSCLVTGRFDSPLVVTGEETADIVVEVAVSINQSFEWEEINQDGKYEPAIETVVDMGTRGLRANVQ